MDRIKLAQEMTVPKKHRKRDEALNAARAAQEGGPVGGGDASDLVFPRYGDILNGETPQFALDTRLVLN